MGTGVCRGIEELAVGVGELDVDKYLNDFCAMFAVIDGSLLGAVVADESVREVDGLDEGGVERDRRDVRAGFGRLEEFCVFGEQAPEGAVVALAEEVGFADGLLGERGVEGEGGRCEEQGGGKDC